MVKLKRLGREKLGFVYPEKPVYTTTWGRSTPVCLPVCPPGISFVDKPDIFAGTSDHLSSSDAAIIQTNLDTFYNSADDQFGLLVDVARDLHRSAADFVMDVDHWCYLMLEVNLFHTYISFLFLL